MTDLLHRTSGAGLDERSTPTITPEYAPPEHIPPTTMPPAAPWPRNAKVIVALLLVVAVLGMLGTILAITSTDDATPAELDAQQTIDELTVERNDLLAEVSTLQADLDATVAERDALAAQVATLQADIDATTTERDVLVADLQDLELATAEVVAVRDDLVDQVEALEADAEVIAEERDELIAQLATLDARVVSLTAERDALIDQVAELEADLLEQASIATSAIYQRDALANLFPIAVDVAVDVDAVVDTYDLDYTQAFCRGFGMCDTVPAVDEMIIRKTTDDRLEMVMPGNPAAGLMLLDGVLYAVFDSDDVAPRCNGATRPAQVTVTVFPEAMTVASDGTSQVASLAASMTVLAPTTTMCPAGMAFYGAQLTPSP